MVWCYRGSCYTCDVIPVQCNFIEKEPAASVHKSTLIYITHVTYGENEPAVAHDAEAHEINAFISSGRLSALRVFAGRHNYVCW